MKQLCLVIVCCCLLLFSVSLKAQVNPSTSKEASPNVKTASNRTAQPLKTMKGAYDMTLQKVRVDNRDSIYAVKQLKIYTDKHFMYAHELPGDSLGSFGVGTYRVENGGVVEYPFYTSSGGAQQDTIALEIMKRGEGYTQVINFPPDSSGRAFVLTEDYRTASRNVVSPLDGAWKMTKIISHPKGGTPREYAPQVQYKFFQSGHYMWGRTERDSASQKPMSFFGYGTFEMTSPKEVKETTTNSTIRSLLVGEPVKLQVAFKGKDTYEQTIIWPDGDKTVEVYQRLK